MFLREKSHAHDNRHRDSDAKNSDESQGAPSQRKANTKAREQGKHDQLSQRRRHVRTLFAAPARRRTGGGDLPQRGGSS
jgi:hypothetical protein